MLSAGRPWRLAALVVAVAAVAAGVLALACTGGGSQGTDGAADAASEAPRPNIVFVLSDDQPDSTFRQRMMPRTFEALDRAVDFSDAIAAPPLCCPYRAGVVSGQYPQNHGVEMSHPGYADLRDKKLVLPEFLRQAGYTTAFVGKYLNGTQAALGTEPAPGWDRWVSFADQPGYEDPALSIDGRTRTYRGGRRSSEIFTEHSLRFVDSQRDSGSPFFLWLAHYAPHPQRGSSGPCGQKHAAPARPADFRFARGFDFPSGPSWNRPPVAKPRWVREAADRLSGPERREMVSRWQCALGALQEVDRSLARLVERLEHNGQMRDTFFVFGSDNGTNFGEHQLQRKKGIYEEKLQVPLMIQAPRGAEYRRTARSDRPELVSEVDLAATMLEIAGAEPCVQGDCRRLDGRSLLELLRDRAAPEWSADRAIPIKTGTCWIRAYRTPDSVFINSEPEARKNDPESCSWPPRGFAELYRLDADPDQLHNRAPRLTASTRNALIERLDSLQRCTGIAGRDPVVEGRPFCE